MQARRIYSLRHLEQSAIAQKTFNCSLQNGIITQNQRKYGNDQNKNYQNSTKSGLLVPMILGCAASIGFVWNNDLLKQNKACAEEEQQQEQKAFETPIDQTLIQVTDDQLKQQQEQEQKQQQIEQIQTPAQDSQPLLEEQQEQQSIMKELTRENIKEVMTSTESKFIYFYRPSKFSQEDFDRVEEHASKMYNGLRIQPYKIDLDANFTDFSNFLKERNPTTAASVEKQIEENCFLLANQYDDIWFWEFDLIKYFYGDLLEQIFNFYQGPQKLMSEDQIIMNQSTENELHIMVYVEDRDNKESIKKMKNYRKFHTKNTDKFFHFKYWITDDKDLAKKLKIDTSESAVGDVYLIRKSGIFNQRQKNIKLSGYDYHSEKILSAEDTTKDISNSYAKILQYAFNSPVQVHDYMTFAALSQKFKTNMFVVYCDQKENPKQYNEILRAMIKARKHLPINLKPDENGQLQKTQRQQDVVFVISTTKNLMPITKIHGDQPQGLFVTPEDNFVDLLNVYLPSLEKIEDFPPQEFLRKAFNNEQEFKYEPTDDDKDRNRKDTSKLIYSPDRFIMGKMYQTVDIQTLTNYEKIAEFVKQSINGELKYYWDTEGIPHSKYAQKVVGEDFDKRILQTPKDALVLVYHPSNEKNRDLKNQYDEFVRSQGAVHGISQDGQLVYAKYNGINESQQFKSPQKLPQILYFKKVADQDEKEIIEMDLNSVYGLMTKSISQEEIQKRIREFVNKNKTL